MINPLFYGKILNQKIKLDNISKERYKTHLQSLEGKDVIFRLQKDKPLRSGSQNRYYWGVIVEGLADELGYDPDEMHEALRWKFLRDNTKKIPTVKGTSSLTIDEFGDYCEKIRVWAGRDLGILIPLPGEVDIESIYES